MSGRDAAEAARVEAPVSAQPLYLAGPDGPWDELQSRFGVAGRAVVHTTWGVWAPAALLDPGLRPLLARDWPRYRQQGAAESRLGFAASRYLMKHTVAAVLEVPAAEVDFSYQPGGRPAVRGWEGELELSLSHTDELLVVGVSRTGPVGVDAEPAGREISFDLLGEQVCTPAEARALAELPEEERRARMLRLWTLKEAYTKAVGYGLRRRFSQVGFRDDEAGHTLLTGAPDAGQWEFATHLVQDGYVVSEAHRLDRPVSVRSSTAPSSLEEPEGGPGTALRFRPGTSGSG
ncbi:4'-phosphopantetheinyl transferase family protein [Streptomyces sp. NPDC006739]|uniref:4'-phosphopantetheinyl transferase family protein n=1 Tax=Streptomyces sp. NPDC006739 TaxID=3364763 RepID=UPI00367A5DEC